MKRPEPMSGGKSVARVIGHEAFSQCEVHVPEFRARSEPQIYDHDMPLKQLAGDVATGRVVLSEAFEHIVPRANTIEAFPSKLIEERRSAHGVTFGRMLVRGGAISSDSRHNGKTAFNVALKPFGSHLSSAREMRGYETLRRLDVPTFEPVGIFPSKDGEHMVNVTLTNPTLISLDRMDWVYGRMPDSEKATAQAERNALQVQGIAETLAYIHSNGVFHPDGQIKNWVTDPSDKVGVIDTEKHIEVPLMDQNTEDYAWEDIEILVKSLVIDNSEAEEGKVFGVGMLAGLPLDTVRNSIEELIIQPYTERLETILDETDDELKMQQIESLYDGLTERFHRDATWPKHFIDSNKR